MKNEMKLFTMICLSALVFLACNNDDDGDGGGTDPASVVSISDAMALEGGAIEHTVTVTNNTEGASFSASVTNGSASDADFTADLASATLSAGVTFAGGQFTVPANVGSFTVGIATIEDNEEEDNETYTLTIGGQSGTGTITDVAPTPLFGVGGFNFTPEGQVAFFTLVESLDSGVTDLSGALEIPGGALFVTDGNGTIFVGRSDSPTVTKFTLDADNTLVEGESVSFANAGLPAVAGFPNQFQFISDTKAYFVDAFITQQVVVWNPSDMTFTGSFPITGLPEVSEGGSRAINTFVRTDDKIIANVRYNSADGFVEQRMALLFIDTQTDAVTFDTIDTCGGISQAVFAENGDLYFASNSVLPAEFVLGIENAFEPCWVRVLAGTSEIDDSFSFNPNTLTGSRLTAGLVNGPGNSAYVVAYDEDLIPIDPGSTPREVQETQAWRLWSIADLNNLGQTATLVTDFPATAGNVFPFVVEDNTYFAILEQDFSGGQLINVTNEANIFVGIDIGFLPQSVFRLR